MSLDARIQAAAAAVAAHTDALGIDDDGDPVGIGAWHLLYSLYDYCEARDMPSLEVVAATEQDWKFDKPFLIMVAHDYGRIVPGMPRAFEYEVMAANVEEACAKVVQAPVMRMDAERRLRHEPYTDRYVKPNWDMYAGGAVIGENRPDTIKAGIQSALELEWLSIPPRPDTTQWDGFPDERDTICSAEFALQTYRAATWDYEPGNDEIRSVENLLRGLREYLVRFGEDFDEMLKDVRENRNFIQGRENTAEEPASAWRV